MPADDPSKAPPEGAPPTDPNSTGAPARWLANTAPVTAQRIETFLNRAQAQIQMQRWDDALASLESVLALSATHPKAHELRQQVLSRLSRRNGSGP